MRKDLSDSNIFFDKSFQESRQWYFVSRAKKFRRKATLVLSGGNYELVTEDDPRDPQIVGQLFEYATAKNSYSRMTLFNCRAIKHNLFLHGSAKLIPQFCVHQVMSTGNISNNVTNIKGQLAGLNYFFDKNLLKFNDSNREFTEKKDYYMSYELNADTEIKLLLELKNDSNVYSIETYQESMLELKFKKAISIASAVMIFKKIEDFFNFIFSEITDVQSFYSHSKRLRRRGYYSQMKISGRNLTISDLKRDRSDYQLLFNLNDVADCGVLLRNWIVRYDMIINIWDELKYIRTRRPPFNEEFLILVRLIEAISRTVFEKYSENEIKIYKQKVEKIVGELSDPNDKEFVEKKLEFGYEQSLRSRLSTSNKLASSFGVEKLSKRIINKIISTRNVLTHPSFIISRSSTLDLNELVYCNQVLQMQLSIMIMLMIKMSHDEIEAVVKKSTQFKILT